MLSCGHRSLLRLLSVCEQGFIQTPLVWAGNSKYWGCRWWGLGLCLQRGPGAETLIRGSLGRSPHKLEAFRCVSSWFLYVQCIGSYCGNTAYLLYVCNDDRNCMNYIYTVNHKKVAVHLCHNIRISRSIFRILALKQEEIFKTCMENVHLT